MFGADMWTKMATNPKLSPFLAQPDVVAKLQQIQANPNLINTFMTDQRIMTIMMGLMGLDGSMGGGAGDEQDTEMTDVKNSTAKYEEEEVEEEEGKVVEMNPDSTLKSKVEKKNEPEVIVETKKEEDSPRQASNSKKEEGNIKYKDRKFADAIVLYDAAFELDKTNVSVLTNKSAVLYEQELFQECIKVCEEAIEIGQALYADFKLLAR